MSRQKLGQHFLHSSRTLERIAAAVCGSGDPRAPFVVEIGPGRGALTEHLLNKADRIAAIEIDPDLVEFLKTRWEEEDRLSIIEGNALDLDWQRWGAGTICGNLPYYVSTAIISKYLRKPGLLTSAVFLIQKEVADRITALPGTRDFGYFSVECQLLSQTENLFRVPPGAFRPPPKVDSAVIRLTPKPNPFEGDIDSLLSFVSTCFQHKRKTLRNNLLARYSAEQLEHLPGLTRRAEQLTVAEFVDLYRRVSGLQVAV